MRFEIGFDLRAEIDLCVRVGRRFREFGWEAGIDKDDFAAGIDYPVLQAGAVLDRRVKSPGTFAAKGERFRHKAVFGETDGLDIYAHAVFSFR